MKCPVCSQEMTPGAKTALCLHCGHAEPLAPRPAAEAPTAEVAPAPDPALVPDPSPTIVESEPVAPPLQPPANTTATPEAEVPASLSDQPTPPPAQVEVPAVLSDQPTPVPVEAATPTIVPAKKSSRQKLAIIGASVAAVILLGAGGAFAYATYQMPKTALVGYLNKLVNSKTGLLSGTAVYSASPDDDSFGLGKVSIALSGSYDVTNQADPKVDLTVGGTSSGSTIKGNVRVLDKALYFKLGSLGILQDLGIALSNDWYKLPLDDTTAAGKCQTASSKSSHPFLGSQILTKLPLKDTKLVALTDTVSGHRAAHYRGTLDNAKLQSFIDDANKDLPAECQLTQSASDLDGTVVSYDLWSSHNFDRLIIHATNTKDKTSMEATFDTSAYNKPVTITAPAGAKALPDLFSGEGSSADSGPVLSANDSQREADIRSLQTNLEEYFAINGTYPVATGAASTVLVKPLTTATSGSPAITKTIPKDPKNAGAYVYRYTASASDSYKLTACLESTSADDSDTVAPVAPCTTRTYEITSLN